MELYIYNADTLEIVETVKGETNQECEAKANELNYDLDEYGWSYTSEGLTE